MFINERGAPLSPDGFAKTLERAGARCACWMRTRTRYGIRAASH